jgi:drug/metabolite transporter (DMT)-like permease
LGVHREATQQPKPEKARREAALPAAAFAVVILSAFLHASWNAFAHAVADRLIGFALIGVAGTAVSIVLVTEAPLPARASWPYIAASGAIHVLYTLLLMYAYRLGDFSQMYPISRGTSPWLVAVIAAVLLGETLSPLRLAGVAVISAGLACLVVAGGVPDRGGRTAIGAALLTGVAIATYTAVDGVGVRHAGTTAGYTGWIFLLQSPVVPLIALATRRREVWRQARPHLSAGLTGGLLSMVAYGLVLWAQTKGPLALVAALRECSVVIGALIGAVAFHERLGRWRVVAAVLVAVGVLLVAL